jgi:hypothetical protein
MPVIKFDRRSIIRWSRNSSLNVQPMMDQGYQYADQCFESLNGFWVFNGRIFGALDELKEAIEDYNAKIDQLLAVVADS